MKLMGHAGAWKLDSPGPRSPTSDESLVARARIGDRRAFAELWQRHARSGKRVARQFTSSIDADDLVAEAYTRIYERVLAGGGPVGAFRPYLYTTIRNLASRWGQANREVQVDDIGDFEDPDSEDDPVTSTLDRTLTARAFRSLPGRWQAVLWYTEVEGMDPHEVAPILGLTANGVAALSYRAREGLRKAWLQAHISDTESLGECGWVLGRLGDYTRNGLTERDHRRVAAHLEGCAKCSLLSQEVDDVGSQLAMVLLPLLFGASVGGSLLAAFSAPGAATAAQLAAIPALPVAFQGAAATASALALVAAPAAAAGLGSVVPASLVGTFTLALVVSGGLAVGISRDVSPAPQQSTSAQPSSVAGGAEAVRGKGQAGKGQAGNGQRGDGIGGIGIGIQDGVVPSLSVHHGLSGSVGNIAAGVGGTVNGMKDAAGVPVHNIASPLNTVIPSLPLHPGPVPEHSAPGGVVGAVSSLDLGGTGMPGATVSAQAGGIVYGATVVTRKGTWAVHASALPNGVVRVTLKQTLRILGVAVPLETPLKLLSSTPGVTVELLN